jgi:plasmid stabilization system protein ParE
MIRVIYRDTAQADLKEIESYYTEISSHTSLRVHSDIYGAIHTLQLFPMAGRELSDGRRRFVSSQFRFVISHKIYSDRIEIVGVYRQQNRKS